MDNQMTGDALQQPGLMYRGAVNGTGLRDCPSLNANVSS